MFNNPACVWQFGPINRKSLAPYSQTHPTFVLIRELAEIRFQNRLIQNGVRTLLCSRNNGLWCVLIHDPAFAQPLFVAMNLGAKPVFEKALPIGNWYGEFCGVDLLIATSGGEFHVVEGGIQIRLPAFTFVLGRLFRGETGLR